MRKIKSIFLFLMVLTGFSVSLFAADKHSDIDKFLKSYEEVVVQVEKAAKSNNLTDLLKYEKKIMELSEQVEKMEENEAWSTKDAMKFLELTNRYSKAVSSMTSDTMDSFDVSGALDMLGSFGF